MPNFSYSYPMKFILTLAIAFLCSFQLIAQSEVSDAIPFEKLKASKQEIKRGGTIDIYSYEGEYFTGVAIEKKLTTYFLYHIKNGKKHGEITHYTKGNRKKMEWVYQKGILRIEREWYSDGDLKSETEFNKKSRLKTEKEWYRNSELKAKLKYGRRSDRYQVKHYSKKGKISEKGMEIHIESGKKIVTKKIGKWVYYDRHGKRKKVEVYDEKGDLISSKKH